MKMEQLENGCLKIFLDDTDMQAVSYTHLDVYKRQFKGSGVQTNEDKP